MFFQADYTRSSIWRHTWQIECFTGFYSYIFATALERADTMLRIISCVFFELCGVLSLLFLSLPSNRKIITSKRLVYLFLSTLPFLGFANIFLMFAGDEIGDFLEPLKFIFEPIILRPLKTIELECGGVFATCVSTIIVLLFALIFVSLYALLFAPMVYLLGISGGLFIYRIKGKPIQHFSELWGKTCSCPSKACLRLSCRSCLCPTDVGRAGNGEANTETGGKMTDESDSNSAEKREKNE